ncbi:MAG: squalene/phytoene synthase family protein [Acidobacteriota bacterium]
MNPQPDLDVLLEKTSRTFALSIPLLPEPTRREVTIAYLLFRIADTFEDAAVWPPERRKEALAEFSELLDQPRREQADRLAASWRRAVPSDHAGYLELVAATPTVLKAFEDLSPAAQRIVRHHTLRTARGMADFVDRADASGRLELRTFEDLVDYCYIVAGIVGELLTDLFLLDRPALASLASYLVERAAAFGEGLQLVNILKDSAADAEEGRQFLPDGVSRSQVFTRARTSLVAATEYVRRLQEGGSDRGLVAFTALPVRLAWASLDRVESAGAGAKLTREEVYALAGDLDQCLTEGRPAVAVPTAVL